MNHKTSLVAFIIWHWAGSGCPFIGNSVYSQVCTYLKKMFAQSLNNSKCADSK